MKFTLIFSIKWVHALPKLTGEWVSPQLINWVCRAFGDLQMEGAKQSENYHNFPPLSANPGPDAVCKSTATQLNSCRCICYSGALAELNNFQMEFLGSSFDFANSLPVTLDVWWVTWSSVLLFLPAAWMAESLLDGLIMNHQQWILLFLCENRRVCEKQRLSPLSCQQIPIDENVFQQGRASRLLIRPNIWSFTKSGLSVLAESHHYCLKHCSGVDLLCL